MVRVLAVANTKKENAVCLKKEQIYRADGVCRGKSNVSNWYNKDGCSRSTLGPPLRMTKTLSHGLIWVGGGGELKKYRSWGYGR